MVPDPPLKFLDNLYVQHTLLSKYVLIRPSILMFLWPILNTFIPECDIVLWESNRLKMHGWNSRRISARCHLSSALLPLSTAEQRERASHQTLLLSCCFQWSSCSLYLARGALRSHSRTKGTRARTSYFLAIINIITVQNKSIRDRRSCIETLVEQTSCTTPTYNPIHHWRYIYTGHTCSI